MIGAKAMMFSETQFFTNVNLVCVCACVRVCARATSCVLCTGSETQVMTNTACASQCVALRAVWRRIGAGKHPSSSFPLV